MHSHQSVWTHDLTKREGIAGGVGGEAQAAGGKGGLGADSPAANEFLRFHIKKHSF